MGVEPVHFIWGKIPFTLSSDVLNPLLNLAFTREMTWLEASNRFELDDFIEMFQNARKRVHESLEEMTDTQVKFASSAHSLWSISESITHLVFTQGFYINNSPYAVYALAGSVTLRCAPQNTAVTDRLRAKVRKVSQ